MFLPPSVEPMLEFSARLGAVQRRHGKWNAAILRDALRGRSALESFVARLVFVRYRLQLIDACRWRTGPGPGDELRHALCGPLEERFDAAIGSVSHPAGHPSRARFVAKGVAVAHSLYPPADAEPSR